MGLDFFPIRALHFLLRSGYKAVRAGIPPEEVAYRRVAARGFVPASIIDVGAYEGNWTRLARRVFPGVPVLMVEPQGSKKSYLERVTAGLPGAHYVQALLTSQSGEEKIFFEMETGSSIFPENSNVSWRPRQLVSRTLDDIAARLPSPIMLKIDVQGAELEVLTGGEATMERCQLIQLEVALVPYNAGAPMMLDVLKFMDARGFQPFDISGQTRPDGVNLAQIDLLFAPTDSPLRKGFFEFPAPGGKINRRRLRG